VPGNDQHGLAGCEYSASAENANLPGFPSPENNMIGAGIPEAARESSRTGKTIRLPAR
jgi:hypothetical protein